MRDIRQLADAIANAFTARDNRADARRQAADRSRPPKQVVVPYTHEGKDTDFTLWRLNFTRMAATQQWNDTTARQMCAYAMRGRAQKSVQRIPVVPNPYSRTLEDLLNQYEERLLPPAQMQASANLFENARQAPKEDLITWHNRVFDLYARAYPRAPYIDHTRLIRVFTKGLRSTRIRDAVVRANVNHYDHALAEALNEESVVYYDQAQVHTVNTIQGECPDDVQDPSINVLDKSQMKCHRCGKPGHFKQECRVKLDKPAKQKKPFLKKFLKKKDSKGKPKTGKEDRKKKVQFRKKMINTIAALYEDSDSDSSSSGSSEERDEDGQNETGIHALGHETDTQDGPDQQQGPEGDGDQGETEAEDDHDPNDCF